MLRVHCNGCHQPFGDFIESTSIDPTQFLKWHCPDCSSKRADFETWCAKKRIQMEEQLDNLIEEKRQQVFGAS